MATTGRYEERDGQPVVRFQRTVAHPVTTVWEAITEPAQLEEWFPTSVALSALAPGAEIEFHFPQDAYPPMTGKILAVEPERRFEFTWGEDRLTFELEPRDGGEACRLSLTVVLDGAEKAARDAAGWEQCLDMLETVAAGGIPERPAHTAGWRAYYEEYQRLGLPAEAPIPEPGKVTE
jgi:uncharacterized protein YndB with AHSA1/START domain